MEGGKPTVILNGEGGQSCSVVCQPATPMRGDCWALLRRQRCAIVRGTLKTQQRNQFALHRHVSSLKRERLTVAPHGFQSGRVEKVTAWVAGLGERRVLA